MNRPVRVVVQTVRGEEPLRMEYGEYLTIRDWLSTGKSRALTFRAITDRGDEIVVTVARDKMVSLTLAVPDGR
jgi:hypothetical protein